ncbi:EamA family transporter [candidate division KSB1 bacterium]|nr:EamA family transporter [candidate division KSB1 bacterium]
MLQGLLFIVLTGILWSIVGIVFGYIARKRFDFIAVMGISTPFNALMTWLFVADHQQLFNDGVSRTPELILVMVLSGIISVIAFIIMQQAMRIGHHGIIWTISQSAMVIPYLFGVLVFGESVPLLKGLGMLVILSSFVLLGIGKNSARLVHGAEAGTSWFILALVAFLLLGIHQSLTTLPTYWHNWQDSARLRIPLIYSGLALGYLTLMFLGRRIANRRELWLALILSAVGIPSNLMLYRGMDLLRQVNMVSISYPLALGITIASFVLYNLCIVREPTSKISLIGLVATVSGLVLISV